MLRFVIVPILCCLTASVAGGGERQVLDFQAPWCGPCQVMNNTIWPRRDAQATLRQQKLRLVPVNIDRQKQSARQWRVGLIPCLIVVELNESGEAVELRRHTGKLEAQQLIEFLKEP